MSNKVLNKIIVLAIALIALYMPKCFAAGANISTNITNAEPGDAVELYIDLSIPSIGYDLKINNENSNLISKKEIVNKIGNGDTSRIYLVQIAGADDRIIYQSGTRISTIKYTISEDAIPGSTITFNVSGDVAGETSSNKNKMNETITINIVAPKEEPPKDEGGSEPEVENPPKDESGNEPEVENPPKDESGNEPEVENPPKEESGNEPEVENPSKDESGNESEVENPPKEESGNEPEVENPSKVENEKEPKKDDTVVGGEIPKAGLKGLSIVTVIILIVIMLNSFKKCDKNKDIK